MIANIVIQLTYTIREIYTIRKVDIIRKTYY